MEMDGITTKYEIRKTIRVSPFRHRKNGNCQLIHHKQQQMMIDKRKRKAKQNKQNLNRGTISLFFGLVHGFTFILFVRENNSADLSCSMNHVGEWKKNEQYTDRLQTHISPVYVVDHIVIIDWHVNKHQHHHRCCCCSGVEFYREKRM